MKKHILILTFFYIATAAIPAQEFLPIWSNTMPNSKGLPLRDSIANERIYQVATPGIYVFTPSVAENKNAAVLIIPGGGYARLAYQISGFQLAKYFNAIGITAFVLNHRLPQSPDVVESHKAPLQDAQRAIKFIRSNAEKWKIDINKVGVMGSSAGGHLAVCLSTFTEDWSRAGDEFDTAAFIPNFAVLVSPVISMNEHTHVGSRDNLLGKAASQKLKDTFSCEKRVTAQTPPAFMVHASNDKSVSSLNSILYYTALKQNGVTASSLHIYPQGGHSIALRNNPGSTNTWTTLLEEWLMEINIIKEYL